MAGLVTRVDALEATLLAEGTSPASTAIALRVQALEDICLGERSEGALLTRVQLLEEACFGQAQGAPPAAVASEPIGRAVSRWPAQVPPAAVAAPAGAYPAEGGRVFVGDLPADVESEELQVTFGAFGGVSDVHVMRGKATSGRSCAFVVLDSWEAGERAIQGLSNQCSLREGDQPMIVSWPKNQTTRGPDVAVRFTARADTSSQQRVPPAGGVAPGLATKLFVGNLPTEVQPEALQGVFGTYGVVTNVHVMAGNSRSGQSCAFIEYATAEEAETAIFHLHEKYETLPGQGNIIVKHANAHGTGKGSRAGPY